MSAKKFYWTFSLLFLTNTSASWGEYLIQIDVSLDDKNKKGWTCSEQDWDGKFGAEESRLPDIRLKIDGDWLDRGFRDQYDARFIIYTRKARFLLEIYDDDATFLNDLVYRHHVAVGGGASIQKAAGDRCGKVGSLRAIASQPFSSDTKSPCKQRPSEEEFAAAWYYRARFGKLIPDMDITEFNMTENLVMQYREFIKRDKEYEILAKTAGCLYYGLVTAAGPGSESIVAALGLDWLEHPPDSPIPSQAVQLFQDAVNRNEIPPSYKIISAAKVASKVPEVVDIAKGCFDTPQNLLRLFKQPQGNIDGLDVAELDLFSALRAGKKCDDITYRPVGIRED